MYYQWASSSKQMLVLLSLGLSLRLVAFASMQSIGIVGLLAFPVLGSGG
jgi:hypothetical protein